MNVDTYFLSIVLIEDPAKAAAGPGWYIYGRSFDPRRISTAVAEEIGRAFETAFTGQDEGAHAYEVIRTGSLKAHEAAKKQLEEAERVAASVPQLRQILQELS